LPNVKGAIIAEDEIGNMPVKNAEGEAIISYGSNGYGQSAVINQI